MITHILHKKNRGKFLDYLQEEKESSTDRNVGWFEEVHNRVINQDYPLATWCEFDNGDIFSFSLVQKHNFPEHVYRVMSRLYVTKKFRAMDGMKYIHDKDNLHIPSKYLFPLQYKWCKENKDTKFIIFTMEHVNRRRPIRTVTGYFNRNYNTRFEVQPDMYETFHSPNDWRSWQNVSAMRFTDESLPMDFISVDEWKKRFGNPKLVGESF